MPYGSHSYKQDLRNLLMTAYVVALFEATEKHAGKNSKSALLLNLWTFAEKNAAGWTLSSLEAVSPGIEHNMKTKCGAWEIQVKVARLARVESLQLFQEHFYFCTIVHFFLAQKILNILKTAFLESKQPREQPISVIQFLLVPKNLWPQNTNPHKSSSPGLLTLWESSYVIIIWKWEESTEIHSNKYSTASGKRENDTKVPSFQLSSKMVSEYKTFALSR